MEFVNAPGVDHGPVRRAAAQQRGGNVKRSTRLRLFEKPRSLGERRFRHVVEGECHDRFFVFQRNGPRWNMTRQARGNVNDQGPMGVRIGEGIEVMVELARPSSTTPGSCGREAREATPSESFKIIVSTFSRTSVSIWDNNPDFSRSSKNPASDWRRASRRASLARVRLSIALTRRLLIKFETLDCVIQKSGMLVEQLIRLADRDVKACNRSLSI